MKIITLIENQYLGTAGLACEHGLSLYIEFRNRRYLLDTGASTCFSANAKKLGVDLSKIDVAVLSHAHYDHSGGFESFCEENKNACIYLQEAAKNGEYVKIGPIKKYVGIPKKILESCQERFTYVSGKQEIDSNVYVLAHTTPGLAERGKKAHMAVQTAGELRADDFAHEQSLIFDTSEGLIVLNSCSHAGADVVIREALEAFPGRKVRAMIGGFHLMGIAGTSTMGVSKEEVEELSNTLKKLDAAEIYTAHCTGTPAFKILKGILGEGIHEFHTADVLEFAD